MTYIKTNIQLILLIVLACSSGRLLAQFEPFTGSAEIEVWLKGAAPGTVRLYSVWGNQNLLKDSAVSDAEGKVIFRNSKRYTPGFYYAVYDNNSAFLGFLLDQNQKFYLRADKADIIYTMNTNSAENKLFFESQVYDANLTKQLEQVNAELAKVSPGMEKYTSYRDQQKKLAEEKEAKVKEYFQKNPGSFFAAFKTMGQNPKLKEPKKTNGDLDTIAQLMLYRSEFWNNYDFNDERMVRTPVYFNKLNTYLNGLFPQRVDSVLKGVKYILEKVEKGDREHFNFTVNYLLMTYYESSLMGGEKIYCYTVDNYFTHKKAYWSDSVNIVRAKYESDIRKASLLGETGQDLRCKNEKGDYVSLYAIKAPIKIVYLYNPDCEHCQKETPKLKVLYDKWKTRGVEIYALNVEHDDQKWHDYIKKLNLDWINVNDNKYESNYHKKYHIKQTPGLYILDKNNKIVAKQLMPDNLEPTLEFLTK